MRISDWSSDVCSSDLDGAAGRDEDDVERAWRVLHPEAGEPRRTHRKDHDAIRGQRPAMLQALRLPAPGDGVIAQGEDRNSVGEGKSGAGRVDLGGRRLIKTHTKKSISNK